MAITEHYYTQFSCNRFYHVYNRTVDLKPMFCSKENRRYFLRQYNKYLGDVVDTYAYNLLGNHFHILILTASKKQLDEFKIKNRIKESWSEHDIISHQFKKFFQSYAMAFNKQQQRVGTLFQTPFKRALIDNQKYLLNTIAYIHQNGQHHGLVDDFRDWEWSSYNSLLGDKETKLKRIETLKLFGSLDAFYDSNNQLVNGKEFLELEL